MKLEIHFLNKITSYSYLYWYLQTKGFDSVEVHVKEFSILVYLNHNKLGIFAK